MRLIKGSFAGPVLTGILAVTGSIDNKLLRALRIGWKSWFGKVRMGDVGPQKAHEEGRIMIVEESNKSKFRDCEQRSLREVFEKDSTANIINFESGRKALKKDGFDDEQNRARLMERGRLPSRLPEDWLEFLLTLVLFFGLLLGLVGGVIALWRS
jgi:hypothetical protein